MSYRLLVGLGNPGKSYAATRHNVGARVVEAFAARNGVADAWTADRKLKCDRTQVTFHESSSAILAVRSRTYMNESGLCLLKVGSFFKIPPEEMVVVHDEINLPLGELKVSVGGSAGGHNGLKDIIARTSPAFTRLRIGIGQKPSREMDLADYVLADFASEEESVIAENMDRFIDGLQKLLVDGPQVAMNEFNRRNKTNDRDESQV